MTNHDLLVKRRKKINLYLEHGMQDKIIKFFRDWDSIDDLAVKCVLWGHIFMPEYFSSKSPDFHYEMIKKFFNNNNEYNAYPRGFGKALSLETLILTSCGFKDLSDIKIGDKVFSEKGELVDVLYKSEVYNDRDCYKVKFSDGSEIIADATHDWMVEDNLLRHRVDYKSDKPRKSLKMAKMTTEELSKDLFVDRKDGRKELKYSIPTTEPLKFGKKDLLVDPYFLGQWLGDGTSANCAITTEDEETVGYIYAYAADLGLKVRVQETGNNSKTYNITSGKGKDRVRSLTSMLNKIGVLNNKHIPDIYKHSDQRIEVLRGLMDSDGYINKKGYCEFTTINSRLAVDTLELIKSFGIKATIGCYDATIYGKIVGKKYRICFTTDVDVFSLSRKKARKTARKDPRIKRRFITDIEKVKSVPVQCLQVDNPTHLFLAGKSLVPTHNTTVTQVCISFAVANGMDKFIVLVEKTFNEASEVLESVRDQFRHGDAIKSVYGDLTALSARGRKSDLGVKDSVGDFFINGVRLRGLGFNKSIRGLKSRESRPTRIILDDVESDEHIDNPDQRRKYLNNYLKGIIPSADSEAGNIKMFGTILHDDSLLQTLINSHNGEIYRAWDENKVLLWEEFWTPEKLDTKRKEMALDGRSDAAFYQEYFNEPITEEDQIFRENMFRYVTDKELEKVMEGTYKAYIMLDPAISKATTADYTAIVCIVVDTSHNFYVVEIIRDRLNPAETIKALFAMYERWNPIKVGIETIAYQKSLVYQIEEQKRKILSTVRSMQIVEIQGNSSNGKFEKIKSLQPKYEMGQVYHKQSDPMTRILESELLRFPKSATDDVSDALAGIMQIVAPVRKPLQTRYNNIRRYGSHRQVAY